MDAAALSVAPMGDRISPEWTGFPCVCVAPGPSLSVPQLDLIREWRLRNGCRVIAINDNYRCMPWADVLYFADHRWWEVHRDRPSFKTFRGRKITIENGGRSLSAPGVTVLRNLSLQGGTMGRLSTDPAGIYTGQNSGYQAIGVGILFGSRKMILVGYDMRAREVADTEPGKSGIVLRHHWFGNHPWPSDGGTYIYFRQEYARMAPTALLNGIEILNATPGSALECFPMVDLARLVADS